MTNKTTKYIFVTGGVVSSLGKGIVAASLGKLLQAGGYRVTIQKFDPYINIDPGTLNPYEHGECYVTQDGHESDLDLGHYERFLNIPMSKGNNFTTGRIYENVITKERKGEYLGKTVQVVPHITDEIKRNIKALGQKGQYDFVITEIGGVVGDIESLPFLESVRQLKWQLGKDCVCIHLTYVPFIKAAGEYKTKPTQHSVKQLQEVGIQPDILVLRTEKSLPRDLLNKVALFCNVTLDSVVQSVDMPSIYEIPQLLHEQGLDKIVIQKVGFDYKDSLDLTAWNTFVNKMKSATQSVRIALVGKYVELQDAYKSIDESLLQAATYCDRKLDLTSIQSENITLENVEQLLAGYDGVIIAPGFGSRGIQGKLIALEYTRTHKIPTLGICLGMQCMAMEFATNVLLLEDANTAEINPKAQNKIIDIMEEQKTITAVGGSMRLGEYDCVLKENSLIAQSYEKTHIAERHRHRYEFNNEYVEAFENNGFSCVGRNPDTGLIEAIELQDHPWYVGVQYHPEYSSTVLKPSPLFLGFVRKAIENQKS